MLRMSPLKNNAAVVGGIFVGGAFLIVLIMVGVGLLFAVYGGIMRNGPGAIASHPETTRVYPVVNNSATLDEHFRRFKPVGECDYFTALIAVDGLGRQVEITVDPDNPNAPTLTTAQIKACDFLLDNFLRLKPGILDAMLGYYQASREDVVESSGGDAKQKARAGAIMRALGFPSLSDVFPVIDDVEEMERKLSSPFIVVTCEEKGGLAFIGLGFAADWDPEHSYGVMLLGDSIVNAGLDAAYWVPRGALANTVRTD